VDIIQSVHRKGLTLPSREKHPLNAVGDRVREDVGWFEILIQSD
jgi:hypothetical protein